jgi:dihydrofolate reductase
MNMRKVIVSNLISLDGYIEGPGKDLSWHAPGPEFFAYARDLLTKVDTLLFGRITYQMMESYWTSPDAEKGDPAITRSMNELPKWVFSETLKKASWGRWNNARVSADPAGTVRKLKTEKGNDMVIFGSGGLVSALTPYGLIDEYRIMVAPVILGSGTPEFQGLSKRVDLKLASAKTFDSRLVMLTLHPEKK